MQGILGLVDHLVDLVLRVVDLFFGLTSAPIRLALGFEVLVAGHDSSGLLGTALQLIRVSTHRAPPFPVVYPYLWPGRLRARQRPSSPRQEAIVPSPRGHSPLAPDPPLRRTGTQDRGPWVDRDHRGNARYWACGNVSEIHRFPNNHAECGEACLMRRLVADSMLWRERTVARAQAHGRSGGGMWRCRSPARSGTMSSRSPRR